MNIVEFISNWWKETLEYKERVLKDGGTTKREDIVQQYNQMCKSNGIFDSIKFAWLGEAGGKFRDSGTNRFWTKIYSLVTTTDATQTTSTSQPYITGNIAPTERLGMKNPNGGINYMTHPTISFASNEAWSVTTVVNWNKQNASVSKISDSILLDANLNGTLRFSYGGFIVQVAANTLYRYIGKNAIITTICKNREVEFYINGISIPVAAYSGTYVGALFNNINYYSIATSVAGTISAHIIRAQALTPTQIAAEANFLRSLYPEIPSVTIGSQVWATSNCDMVATPQGNLIQNVTLNSNTERITNGGFDTDTNWTKGAGWTISGGTANVSGTASLYQTFGADVTKYYKVTFTVLNRTSGSIFIIDNNGTLGDSISANGTHTMYVKPTTANAFVGFYTVDGASLSIDNVSVQEVGWAGSTDLYNAIYAQTSGTDEQKTYAAVKAAAMWCYYNNDAAVGAIYGKLYNWYAVKLLQMDIDYYNTANPTTPWGWRVPTYTDFNTLATTLGGASVAGGKMKKDGLVYWTTPNTGATNSSGFSALPAGRRIITGQFENINLTYQSWSLPSKKLAMYQYTSVIEILTDDQIKGFSLRLIKN